MVIRFTVNAGYTLASQFFVDDLEVATGTNDCGIGVISHYAIYVDGGTQAPGNPLIPGIACVGTLITIEGHDSTGFPSAPNETITIRTDTNKGSWVQLISGTGAFNDTGTIVDGVASYTFPPGETSATFRFNYTDPVIDNDPVNFNIDSGFTVDGLEDPSLGVQLAGLIFYDETAGGPAPTAFPNQIAGKPSHSFFNAATIAIQAVRTSDLDPLACSPLFDSGKTLDFEFALECLDPATCTAELPGDDLGVEVNGNVITRVASDGMANSTSGPFATAFDITMQTQPSTDPGGSIEFQYNDVGQVQLHARYEIQLNDDADGLLRVGDYLEGNSSAFIVRPFGFDIDFNNDRFDNGIGSSSLSYAASADGTVLASAGEGFSTTISAVGWELGDDGDTNGIPDAGADLSNNQVTRSFGLESTAGDYEALVELVDVVLPVEDPGTGALDPASDNFDDFDSVVAGQSTQDMSFDEVGIIDLSVRLVQTGTSTDDTFMGLDEVADPGAELQGTIDDVGKFVPADFFISAGIINPRSLAAVQGSCIAQPMPGDFTYLGEEFGVSATITARNFSGGTTQNYFGDFAKLSGLDFSAASFVAFDQQAGDDTDYSTRVADPTAGADRSVMWGTAILNPGVATLLGNLIFNRQTSGAEEEPFTALTLGLGSNLVSTEYSGTLPDVTRGFALDLDTGSDATPDITIVADGVYRYGRLLVDNAFGSETEPLGIPFRIEYFDNGAFVLNTDDNCTTIEIDAGTVAINPEDSSIFFHSGVNGVADSYVAPLADGDSTIELDAGAVNGFTGVFEGQTVLRATGGDEGIDRPFEASAPGVDNDGSVIVEFNLTDTDLGFKLGFLAYDWRTPPELEDITANNSYTDNPRGLLDFGSYRGHDRVINWQEIYIGPGP